MKVTIYWTDEAVTYAEIVEIKVSNKKITTVGHFNRLNEINPIQINTIILDGEQIYPELNGEELL